jgi:hypothetical protein
VHRVDRAYTIAVATVRTLRSAADFVVPGPSSIDMLGERLSALSSCRDFDQVDSTVARQSEIPSPERALLCANGVGVLLTEQSRPATNVDLSGTLRQTTACMTTGTARIAQRPGCRAFTRQFLVDEDGFNPGIDFAYFLGCWARLLL